jgi:hypothetical protein
MKYLNSYLVVALTAGYMANNALWGIPSAKRMDPKFMNQPPGGYNRVQLPGNMLDGRYPQGDARMSGAQRIDPRLIKKLPGGYNEGQMPGNMPAERYPQAPEGIPSIPGIDPELMKQLQGAYGRGQFPGNMTARGYPQVPEGMPGVQRIDPRPMENFQGSYGGGQMPGDMLDDGDPQGVSSMPGGSFDDLESTEELPEGYEGGQILGSMTAGGYPQGDAEISGSQRINPRPMEPLQGEDGGGQIPGNMLDGRYPQDDEGMSDAQDNDPRLVNQPPEAYNRGQMPGHMLNGKLYGGYDDKLDLGFSPSVLNTNYPDAIKWLGKLNTVAQLGGYVAAYPILNLATSRGRQRQELINQKINEIAIPIQQRQAQKDISVAVLEITDGKVYYPCFFNKITFYPSWWENKSNSYSAGFFNDNAIQDFFNGKVALGNFAPGTWREMWESERLLLFVTYQDVMHLIFPSEQQDARLFDGVNYQSSALRKLAPLGAAVALGGVAIAKQKRDANLSLWDRVKDSSRGSLWHRWHRSNNMVSRLQEFAKKPSLMEQTWDGIGNFVGGTPSRLGTIKKNVTGLGKAVVGPKTISSVNTAVNTITKKAKSAGNSVRKRLTNWWEENAKQEKKAKAEREKAAKQKKKAEVERQRKAAQKK